MAGTPKPKALRANQLPPRPKHKPEQTEVATEVKSTAKSSSTNVRGEISKLVGGPRDGAVYYTEDLEKVPNAYHPLREGYGKTQAFDTVTWQNGPKYPTGDPAGRGGQLIPQRARIWRHIENPTDGNNSGGRA